MRLRLTAALTSVFLASFLFTTFAAAQVTFSNTRYATSGPTVFTKFTPPAHCTDINICADSLDTVVVADFNNDARLDFAVMQAHPCGSGCGANDVYIFKNISTAGSFTFSRVFDLAI